MCALLEDDFGTVSVSVSSSQLFSRNPHGGPQYTVGVPFNLLFDVLAGDLPPYLLLVNDNIFVSPVFITVGTSASGTVHFGSWLIEGRCGHRGSVHDMRRPATTPYIFYMTYDIEIVGFMLIQELVCYPLCDEFEETDLPFSCIAENVSKLA